MEIVDSARKHGIADADILHAIENPLFVHYFDGYQMIIGPSTSAQMLEIGVNSRAEIFHAMPARPKYYRTR